MDKVRRNLLEFLSFDGVKSDSNLQVYVYISTKQINSLDVIEYDY